MTILLKAQKSKFGSKNQLQVIVKNAVNILMDEVIFDNTGSDKTFITDGLATCSGIALYGDDSGFSSSFTHMSSESTPSDDIRKEQILFQMLEYVRKANPLERVKMIISPPAVEDNHLMYFLEQWAKKQKIFFHRLNKGGDSAVFHISKTGKALILSTSLSLQVMNTPKTVLKKWGGKGVVISASYSKDAGGYASEKNAKYLHQKNTVFSRNPLFFKLAPEKSSTSPQNDFVKAPGG